MTTRVLIPSGALGISFDQHALAKAVNMKPDIICVDGGSTDSGPSYLGRGVSKYSRASTRAEWKAYLTARAKAGVPLVVGTAGTCGTDSTVDWMFEITAEIAAELGQKLKVARIHSQQPKSRIREALAAGRITPLEPMGPLDQATIDACENIVALAGAEQIAAALRTGADVVIAGRTTDTATIAALPLMRGEHSGGAWHGAKIGECGALCSTNPTSGVIVIDFDESGFTVVPTADGARCTPDLVSAHMLYENADPFILHEPGGHLDVRHARYAQADDTRVRVTGSTWVPGRYTVKLEGARIAGYQTMTMVMLREERYVRNVRSWIDRLTAYLNGLVESRMKLGADDYALDFSVIGVDATLGKLERRDSKPAEVGVMLVVTAPTQATATEIAKLANPFLLHYPLTDDEPQATFAFPFSPAETERGAHYEFCLNHVMQLDDPMSAFRLRVDEVGA